MKIVGYHIILRITRFVTLVIRPDYQKFCLRSTPDFKYEAFHTYGVQCQKLLETILLTKL